MCGTSHQTTPIYPLLVPLDLNVCTCHRISAAPNIQENLGGSWEALAGELRQQGIILALSLRWGEREKAGINETWA